MAPIDCLKPSVTASLLTGPGYVSSVVGLAEPPTGANAPPFAFACSACGITKGPFTSLPVFTESGSETDSVASPAVEMTLADIEAR